MASSSAQKGVSAVLSGTSSSASSTALLFALPGRITLITGGMRGIGLEIALAYAEAGAIVYCLDLFAQPDADFIKVQKHIAGLPMTSIGGVGVKGRLEYASCDVTQQKEMWAVVERIAAKEGRVDVCVCNAGILKDADVLEYPADEWKKVRLARNIILLMIPSKFWFEHWKINADFFSFCTLAPRR